MTEQEVIGLERSRIDALIARDWDRIDSLLDRDFEFFHGDGRYSDRPTFLRELREGDIRHHAVELTDVRAFVFDDVGVVFYTLSLHVDAFGVKDLRSQRAVTSVWRRRDGRWGHAILRGIKAFGMT